MVIAHLGGVCNICSVCCVRRVNVDEARRPFGAFVFIQSDVRLEEFMRSCVAGNGRRKRDIGKNQPDNHLNQL